MRRRALLLGLLAATPARAQTDITDADRAAIERVIRDQIAAFRRDDAEAAFAFATDALRDIFGTADRFMAMVRGGYQPVYRPRAFRFGVLDDENGRPVQALEVTGPDGAPRLALYTMERQPDGTWRIAACRLLDPPAES